MLLQNEHNQKRFYTIAILLLTVLAAALRIAELNSPLTYDELSAIVRLRFSSLGDVITYGVKTGDTHPAGVQVFLYLWTTLFGTNALVVRLPFMLMGIACVPLMYRVASGWWNKNAGMVAATIIAVSQYTVYYSIIARPYIFGLFWILLSLYYWTQLLVIQKATKKNVVLFGISMAMCAYSQYFCALTATLLGIAGLFVVQRKQLWHYLAGCALAVLLFLPHLGITFYHLFETKGVGGWIGKPTPRFVFEYLRYLTHFSYFMLLLAIVSFGLMYKTSKLQLRKHLRLMIVALLIFVIPFVLGYIYSVRVEAILQKSVLIFSFPFLVLFATSFVNEKITLRTLIGYGCYIVGMLLTLFIVRQHYTVVQQSYIEPSVRETQHAYEQFGKEHVLTLINVPLGAISYYDSTLQSSYIPKQTTLQDLTHILQNSHADVVVCSKLSSLEMAQVEWYYPYLIKEISCYGTEVYVLSKHKKHARINKKTAYIVDKDITDYNPQEEFPLMVLDTNLAAITSTRHITLNTELSYTISDTTTQEPPYHIVMETYYKDSLIDWRSVSNESMYYVAPNGLHKICNPLRYELCVKNQMLLDNYRVRIYLWNINRREDIHLVHVATTVTEENKYIYALEEEI